MEGLRGGRPWCASSFRIRTTMPRNVVGDPARRTSRPCVCRSLFGRGMASARHRVEPLEFGAESDVLFDRESVVAPRVASHAPQPLVDREDLSECSRRRRRQRRKTCLPRAELAHPVPVLAGDERSHVFGLGHRQIIRRCSAHGGSTLAFRRCSREPQRKRLATRFEAFSRFDHRAPAMPGDLRQLRVGKPGWALFHAT